MTTVLNRLLIVPCSFSLPGIQHQESVVGSFPQPPILLLFHPSKTLKIACWATNVFKVNRFFLSMQWSRLCIPTKPPLIIRLKGDNSNTPPHLWDHNIRTGCQVYVKVVSNINFQLGMLIEGFLRASLLTRDGGWGKRNFSVVIT